MSDATRRLSVRLSVDGAQQTKRDIAEVGESGDRAMKRIVSGAEGASRALSLLGPALAGLSVGALANFARRAVDAVGGLGELADQLGVSTDALQAFRFAATEVGLSNEELERGLAALTRRIADAAQGEAQAEAAFRRFGITFRDAAGNVRATEAVLASVAERMAGIESPAERAALATALFGDRLGQRLIPFLAQGREGLERLTGEALRYGAIADAELIAKADEASDRIAKLERAFATLATNLAARVAPAITAVADALARVIAQAGTADPADPERGLTQVLYRMAELERERARLLARARELGVPEETALARNPRFAMIERELEELRRQEQILQQRLAAEGRAAAERSRRVQEILDGQAQADAERRRQRAQEDIARLRESLDARLRIERAYQDQLSRIRAAEAAGAIDAAERTRLEAQALESRNEALRRLTERSRETTEARRREIEAERERASIGREVEQVIRRNETAYETYVRRLEELGALVERANRAGLTVPDETIRREAEAALKALEEAERKTDDAREAARELGFAFSSAFEDAIVRGRRFSEVLQGIAQDVARIIARRTITEPLGGALSSAIGSAFSGVSFSSIFSGIGSFLGGLFRAEGGPVVAGRPYVVGERGPEWFVPRQSGVVLPNGTAPGGVVINTSVAIDARGADPGVEARLRLMAGQIARQASALTLDAIRRGGAAYDTVRA
jgi:hypothetical protein